MRTSVTIHNEKASTICYGETYCIAPKSEQSLEKASNLKQAKPCGEIEDGEKVNMKKKRSVRFSEETHIIVEQATSNQSQSVMCTIL